MPRGKIEWNELYSTGVDEVDAQHVWLFEFINSLGACLDRLENGEELKPAVVNEIVTFLESYAKLHFGYEEACMTQHRCPVSQTNKEAHAKFLAVYLELRQRLDSQEERESIVKEIYDMAKSRLVN